MDYYKLNDCAYYREERTKQIDFETYITTDNMISNRGGVVKAESLPEAKTVSKYMPCDILLSNIRPYFKKIWFSNREGGCSNDVLVVTAKSEVDPKFLYYVLSDNNFFNYDNVTSKGTKMPRGTPNAIMKYLVPKMIMPKQNKVVTILSTYDNLIDVNNKRIKVLEQMAENLYKEWFVRFRFPGHETAEFENGIPKGWETKTLNEWMIGSFNGGWGEDIAMPKTPHEAAVIRGTDIEDVKASRYSEVPLRYHKENDIKTKLLKENDIVLELSNGNINNIGRTLFITKEILSHFDKVICASFCKVLRFSNSKIAFYIWQFIEYLQNSGLMFFYKNTGANGINNFNFKRFLRMQISIPTDWKDFDILLKTHYEISNIREKNFNLIKQRDMLLPRLMSGKLEV